MKLVIALLVVLFCIPAFAQKKQDCIDKAQFIRSVAEWRDKGNPLDKLQARVAELAKQQGMPEDETAFMLRLIEIVYQEPRNPPDEEAQGFFLHCMNQSGL